MNELKFNSQVGTSIEQSQRLLELGLKPETADMYYTEGSMDAEGNIEYHLNIKRYWISLPPNYIPAWSLHRLIEICSSYYNTFHINCKNPNLYDHIIDVIEQLIKTNRLNLEYLNNE